MKIYVDKKKELIQGFKISLRLSLSDNYSSSYWPGNIGWWWGGKLVNKIIMEGKLVILAKMGGKLVNCRKLIAKACNFKGRRAKYNALHIFFILSLIIFFLT